MKNKSVACRRLLVLAMDRNVRHLISSDFTCTVTKTMNIPGRLPNALYTLPFPVLWAIMNHVALDEATKERLPAVCRKFYVALSQYEQSKETFRSNGPDTVNTQDTVIDLDCGRLYARGGNNYGQCGVGSATGEVPSPRLIRLPPVLHLWGKYATWIAATTRGLYAWGRSDVGQTGTGVEGRDVVRPTLVDMDVDGVTDVSITYDGLFIKTSSGWSACGKNDCGQLGVSTVGANVVRPTSCPDSWDIVRWQCAYNTTFAWTATETLACGENNYGQLGVGLDDDAVPTLTPLPFLVTHALVCDYTTLLLGADRQLYTCGFDQDNLMTPIDDVLTRTPIPADLPPGEVDSIVVHETARYQPRAFMVHSVDPNPHPGQGRRGRGQPWGGAWVGIGMNNPAQFAPISNTAPGSITPRWSPAAGPLVRILEGRGSDEEMRQVVGRIDADPSTAFTNGTPGAGTAIQRWACGNATSFIKFGDRLLVCGDNAHHQLGLGPDADMMIQTVTDATHVFGGLGDIIDVSPHPYITFFKVTGGQGHPGGWVGCGVNDCYQLGLGHADDVVTAPTFIPGSEGVNRWVTDCNKATFAICDNPPRLLACGIDLDHQLGLGRGEMDVTAELLTEITLPTPAPWPPTILNVHLVTFSATLIETSVGWFVCGANTHGELGQGHTSPVPTPTHVPRPLKSCRFGDTRGYYLTPNGELLACGANSKGELGVARPADYVTAMLRVMLWSSNGMKYVFPDLDDLSEESLVICDDTTFIKLPHPETPQAPGWAACGNNTNGELGLRLPQPTPARSTLDAFMPIPGSHGFIDICSHGGMTAAWTDEGGVLTCGANWVGQLGHGDAGDAGRGCGFKCLSVDNAIDIAFSGTSTVILTRPDPRPPHTLLCCGSNLTGHLIPGGPMAIIRPTPIPDIPEDVSTVVVTDTQLFIRHGDVWLGRGVYHQAEFIDVVNNLAIHRTIGEGDLLTEWNEVSHDKANDLEAINDVTSLDFPAVGGPGDEDEWSGDDYGSVTESESESESDAM